MLKETPLYPNNYIQIENDRFFYRDIHKSFSQTDGGKYLSKNIRWGPRKPKQMSNEDWIDIIGYDANNLEHCRLVYGLTRQFIRYQNESNSLIKFDSKEQTILLLTALTHDWPEGLTGNGDRPYEEKTKQDEQDELSVIEEPIINILGRCPSTIKLTAEVKNCLGDISSKLGRAFNIIEALGYVRTALTSWKEFKKTSDIDLKNHLIIITNNVFLNSTPRLFEYSKDYLFVKKFLVDQKELISDAFNMDDSYLQFYPNDKQSYYRQSFNSSKTIWQEWLKQQQI